MRLVKKQNTPAYQYEPAGCEALKLYIRDLLDAKWPEKFLAKHDHKSLVGEEKFDGVRYQIQSRPNGAKHNFMTGRRVSDITGRYTEKQDKLPFVRDHKFPWKDTVFDSEFVGKGISSDVCSQIAKGKATCVVFDITFFEGEDMRIQPWLERRVLLEDLKPFFPKEWMALSQVFQEPLDELPKIVDRGGEGMVLKDPFAEYGSGWWKVIHKDYHDCVIWGFTMATEGKYFKHKWIKNICIAQYVPESRLPKGAKVIKSMRGKKGEQFHLIDVGKVSSGMDDKQRALYTKRQKDLIGEPIEISCKTRLPSGMFRSPVFERLRFDKNASGCLYIP